MFNLSSKVRVFVCLNPCDMRKQAYGLSNIVREGMKKEPRGGDIFVFANRRCDLVRLLFFDGQGYCLFTKRLDRGTFGWITQRRSGDEEIEIKSQELGVLLTLVRLNASKRDT